MAATTTLAAFRGVVAELPISSSEALAGARSNLSGRNCIPAIRSGTPASGSQRILCSSNAVSNSLSYARGSSFFGGDALRSDLQIGVSQGLSGVDDRKFHCFAAHAESNAVAAADYFVDERQLLDLNGSPGRVGGREIPFEASGQLAEEFNPKGLRYDSEDDGGEEYDEEQDVSGGEEVEEDPLAIANLGLTKELEDALLKRGITRLFPIQAAVMEPALEGLDVIARAKTGTGKTLAFGIPILDRITLQNKELRGRRRGGPRCLVMAPTRELAMQVNRELTESAPHLSTLCVYGGVSIDGQMRTLKRGVDITVGTPGRIIDLIDRGALDLSEVKYLVLDEADQMLAVGFEEEVEKVMQLLPEDRQTSLFSATMPSWVNKLSRKYLNSPVTIDLVGKDDGKLSDDVKVMAVRTPGVSKRSILVDLITVYGKGGKSIVFTQTKRDADEVSVSLGRTVGCQALHGDIAQHQREKTLQAFRDGRFSVLVATDVAARGLDIPNVDLVIHYEIPNDPETFVHRSGRTGRAGKSGSAILMYTDNQTRTLKLIERDLNAAFQRIGPPHVDDVLEASSDQAMELIKRVHPELTEIFLHTAEKLLEEKGPAALAAAIAHMSGYTQPPSSKSLLTYEEGWSTVRVVRSPQSYSGPLTSPRSVMGALSEVYKPAADSVGKIKLISDRNIEGAVFDLPEKVAKELLAIKTSNGDEYDIPKELPRLVEEAGRGDRGRTDSYGRFSSRGKTRERSDRGPGFGSRGGDRYGDRGGDRGGDRFGDRFGRSSGRSDRYGSGGGGGDRYGSGSGGGGRSLPRGRSFSTESWDDFDFLAPGGSEASPSFRRGSSSSSFGGVCFLCKQPGHRAAECPSGSGRR